MAHRGAHPHPFSVARAGEGQGTHKADAHVAWSFDSKMYPYVSEGVCGGAGDAMQTHTTCDLEYEFIGSGHAERVDD